MATNWGNYTDYTGPSRAPGSATHVRDARLNLLADLVPGIFTAKTCLDIGCNAGNVACQLAFDFHAASVTGVDIDPKLVDQAEKLLALRSSRAHPPTGKSQSVVDYYPISAVLTHGYRVEPKSNVSRVSSPASTTSDWPCVKFVSADWVASADRAISGPYDVILALSVIKWIHLEHLDEGVNTMFSKCATCLRSGGHLIIELQTWDSYEKAVRPNHSPHFTENLKQLVYRPETSFEGLSAEQGLRLIASSTDLPRSINVVDSGFGNCRLLMSFREHESLDADPDGSSMFSIASGRRNLLDPMSFSEQKLNRCIQDSVDPVPTKGQDIH